MRVRSIPFLAALAGLGAVLTLLVIGYTVVGSRAPAGQQRPLWASDGDRERGRQAIERHGCGSCHVIDGVPRANGRVGPKLVDLHEQAYIGGVLPNGPDNLARWILDPQVHAPRTAMPDLPVREDEARDMAAYLLRGGIREPQDE